MGDAPTFGAGSTPQDVATLQDVAARRRSVRGFLSTPVPDAVLQSVLATAQRAPSWCNIQPWRIVLTRPDATAALGQRLQAAAQLAGDQSEVPFITEYPEPYKQHRRACGLALYQAMAIARDDVAGRADAWLRNFRFFDAPHAMVVSCARALGPYAYVDVGVWLGYLLMAAQAAGLGTCPLASVATQPQVLRETLQIPDDETILFGIAMGWPDDHAPANQCRTERAALADNVRWVDAVQATDATL